MNLKIVMVIAISFLIGITFLYFVKDWHQTNFDIEKGRLNWYSEVAEIQNKVFLIGNSRILVLDEMLIFDQLIQNGKNVIVYDLAVGGATPNYWKDHLDEIVSSKPEIVAIGIDPDDFKQPIKETEIDPYWFLSVDSIFAKGNREIGDKLQSLNIFKFDSKNFQNPKLTTLKIIQFFETGMPKDNFDQIPTQPFFSGGEKLYIITDMDVQGKREIKYQVNIVENSTQEAALIDIIHTLKKNNIHLVLIIPPRPQAFLENWDNEEKKIWDDLLIRLELQTQIKIYTLQNQFSDLNIFADSNHVTRLPEGEIYSEAVAKIILLELDA